MSNSPAPSEASHDSAEHGDNAEDGNSKLSSSKDKECQYCHQKFTSSSLGRHLDQFISKKKPDGIHDVAEIRKLRAGITRRTARGSKKSGLPAEHEEINMRSSKDTSPAPLQPVVTSTYGDHNLNKGPPGTNDVRFNRMNWQATGVITDRGPLPASNPGVQIQSPTSSTPNTAATGTKRSFSVYAADATSSTSNETARALELSLREVLDAVRAATKRAAPPSKPFAFELQAQTFASLCLLLLPTPATLFKASPFATPSTVPLSPPGPDQHHALRQKIPLLVDNWKWDALSHAQRNPVPGGANILEEAEYLTNSARTWISDALTHLDAAYQSYIGQTPEQRQQTWTIEVLRAYKSEQEKLKETNERLDKITQEANQLQQQIDYLSRCQWPREMALWPPERSIFDSSVQQELRAAVFQSDAGVSAESPTKSGKPSNEPSRYDRWDYDKLVDKWRRHVREDRARKTGAQSQTNVPFGSMGPIAGNPSEDSLVQRTNTPPASLRKAMSESAAAGSGQNSPTTNGFNSSHTGRGSDNSTGHIGIHGRPLAETVSDYPYNARASSSGLFQITSRVEGGSSTNQHPL